MAERILETFLDAGLLELNGQDAWFSYIVRAADALAVYLAAHPQELPSFVYSAIDPTDRQDDPARVKALDTLKSVWRTFASVSMGSLDLVLKGTILDAVMQNAERDSQTRLSVALILSSALPHLELSADARVWQTILDRLVEEVETEAEAQWSVPEQVNLPGIPNIEAPTLNGLAEGTKFDITELQAGLERATGPNNAKGESTNGNPHWPNQPQQWAQQFAPMAANAISAAIGKAAEPSSVSIETDDLIVQIRTLLETYMVAAAQRLAAASHGVDLRSRLLWWKEAKISPSARVEYRSLTSSIAPVLMAFDFQTMLPPLAPVSVTAFLRETVRAVENTDEEKLLVDYLKAVAESKYFAVLRTNEPSKGAGLRPLCALVTAGETDADAISRLTVFDGGTSLNGPEIAGLLFAELQASKAVAKISPADLSPANGPDDAAQSHEPTS